MRNNLKLLRDKKNMTQLELAEKAGLSLRTIQRIEAGNNLKGYSLKAIAQALETNPANLFISEERRTDTGRAKLINISALSGFILPFGNLILPIILTHKTMDVKNKAIGKEIIGIQIILSAILSVFMIISPFIQKLFLVKFPLFFVPLGLLLLIKLYVIIKNGISLNQRSELCIKLKTNFL